MDELRSQLPHEIRGPVLVTGGTGFVGSHLVRRLALAGVATHVLARPGASLWRIDDVSSSATIWRGDLTDPQSLERCLAGAKPQFVYHLAGNTSGRQWSEDFSELDQNINVNLKGTLNLVKAIVQSHAPVQCFIRTGSLQEYGHGPVPFDEAKRELPASAYAASEVAASAFLTAMHRCLAFPVIMFRLASVYGPARRLEFFLPSLIRYCLQGRDFAMTAGEQIWDLVYVEDVVDACMHVVGADIPSGEIINVGSGNRIRLRDLAELVVEKTGRKIHVHVGALPDRPGEIPHFYCQTSKASELLGWRAGTSLDAGLERTIQWYREHLDQLIAEGGA